MAKKSKPTLAQLIEDECFFREAVFRMIENLQSEFPESLPTPDEADDAENYVGGAIMAASDFISDCQSWTEAAEALAKAKVKQGAAA